MPRKPCPNCRQLCHPGYCALRRLTNHTPEGPVVRRQVSREELAGELDGHGIEHNLTPKAEGGLP